MSQVKIVPRVSHTLGAPNLLRYPLGTYEMQIEAGCSQPTTLEVTLETSFYAMSAEASSHTTWFLTDLAFGGELRVGCGDGEADAAQDAEADGPRGGLPRLRIPIPMTLTRAHSEDNGRGQGLVHWADMPEGGDLLRFSRACLVWGYSCAELLVVAGSLFIPQFHVWRTDVTAMDGGYRGAYSPSIWAATGWASRRGRGRAFCAIFSECSDGRVVSKTFEDNNFWVFFGSEYAKRTRGKIQRGPKCYGT